MNETMFYINDSQFTFLVVFALFCYFNYVGYISDKRSGGFFIAFSGFIFLYFETLLTGYVSSYLIVPLLTPVALFNIFVGFKKWLFPGEKEE